MQIQVLKAKLHRATVTQTELNYEGSVTIDKFLLDRAGLIEYERVWIYNINNGERFETYTINGEENSGVVCLNGAAARMAEVGDRVIIVAYAMVTPEEGRIYQPVVVQLDDRNKMV